MNKTVFQFEKNMDDFIKLKAIPSNKLVEPIQEGKWSIREILGHIYYWDKYNLEEMVPKMNDGATLPEYPNHDRFNAQAILDLSDQSSNSIIDRLAKTRLELIEALVKVGDGVKFTIGKEEQQISIEEFLGMFVEHDEHHLVQIKRFCKNAYELNS